MWEIISDGYIGIVRHQENINDQYPVLPELI